MLELVIDRQTEIALKNRFCITATAFDKRGKVIASAINSYTDSSKFMRYYAIKAGEPYRKYNHAETRAIELALRTGKTIAKLVVIRYDANGNLANAKPCKVCSCCIADQNIKEVIYSTAEGMVKL